MTKPKGGKSGSYGRSSASNSRVSAAQRRLTKEANSAHRSRGLIKARITALTAKVSLIESELMSVMEMLDFKSHIRNNTAMIENKLLKAALVIRAEEE